MSAVAGIATIDITPPVGIDLLGYARPSPSDGILDRLEATALVLDLPTTRVAVITVDHVGMLVAEVTLLKEQIAAALAIPVSHVVVLFTHTHSGPDTEGANDLVRAYRQVLHANLLHVVKEALANLRPCTVAWGVTSARIGVNRREHHPDGTARMGTNPAGPVDERVGVLRIDDAQTGAPLGLLVICTAHANVLKIDSTVISADFPGWTRRLLLSFVAR